MHITLTDTDLATPSIVPLQIFLQESTETILLVAATSTDQRAGQFTGELLVYSEILPASLPKSGARVKWGEELQMRYHDFLPVEAKPSAGPYHCFRGPLCHRRHLYVFVCAYEI